MLRTGRSGGDSAAGHPRPAPDTSECPGAHAPRSRRHGLSGACPRPRPPRGERPASWVSLSSFPPRFPQCWTPLALPAFGPRACCRDPERGQTGGRSQLARLRIQNGRRAVWRPGPAGSSLSSDRTVGKGLGWVAPPAGLAAPRPRGSSNRFPPSATGPVPGPQRPTPRCTVPGVSVARTGFPE